MIDFKCPACDKITRVRDDYAGKRVRCKCGRVSVVPTSVTDPSDSDVFAGTVAVVAPASDPTGTDSPPDLSDRLLTDVLTEIGQENLKPVAIETPDEPAPATDTPEPATATPENPPPLLPVPRYSGLVTVSLLIRAFGIILIAVGCAAGIIAVAAGFDLYMHPDSDARDSTLRTVIASASTCMIALLSGVFYLAIGQAIQAFIDMAQNSWHTRNSLAVLTHR